MKILLLLLLIAGCHRSKKLEVKTPFYWSMFAVAHNIDTLKQIGYYGMMQVRTRLSNDTLYFEFKNIDNKADSVIITYRSGRRFAYEIPCSCYRQ